MITYLVTVEVEVRANSTMEAMDKVQTELDMLARTCQAPYDLGHFEAVDAEVSDE